MSKEPDSARTGLFVRSYLVGYAEYDGHLSNYRLKGRAYSFAQRILGSDAQFYLFIHAQAAYRQGWHDAAAGRPCQPFPSGPTAS